MSWLKLHELARFDLSAGYVERAAEALGREVAEDEKLVVEPPEADEPLELVPRIRNCLQYASPLAPLPKRQISVGRPKGELTRKGTGTDESPTG